MSKSDWITRFISYTSGQKSPELFRMWTAISVLSGALERRCWSESIEDKPAYPNLYVMLVARPGRGKEIIKIGEGFLRDLTGSEYSERRKADPEYYSQITLSSHDVTTSSIIDELAAAEKIHLTQKDINGRAEQFSYLTVIAEELGVFLKMFDNTLISTLTAFWNNYPSFQQTRRTGNLNILITNPSLNMLIGATPAALGELMPEVAWGMGFMGRMLMVYSDKEVKVRYFTKSDPKDKEKKKRLRKDLMDDLFDLTSLRGQFMWEREAVELMQDWDDAGSLPKPRHSKLEDYNSRRTFFTIKLAMIAAISSHQTLIIYKEDYQRALDWLLEIESFMPDIFRAMSGKSDKDVIEEAHIFLWAQYTRLNNRPVPRSLMINYLKNRVPSNKIYSLIDTMIMGDIVDELGEGGDLVPKPMMEQYGIE